MASRAPTHALYKINCFMMRTQQRKPKKNLIIFFYLLPNKKKLTISTYIQYFSMFAISTLFVCVYSKRSMFRFLKNVCAIAHGFIEKNDLFHSKSIRACVRPYTLQPPSQLHIYKLRATYFCTKYNIFCNIIILNYN